MHCFRYRMDHDYGFAPNPFWGVLTLATCKAQIRKSPALSRGDWIVGLGSVAMENEGRVIYAACVEEIISFDQYWNDERFQVKKPITNGTLLQMYGDNVYHTVKGKVIQEHCAHSISALESNEGHLKTDASGRNVLICPKFYYFGSQCPLLPDELEYIGETGNPRAIRVHDLDDAKIQAFVDWLASNYETGIHGDPCNWKEFEREKYETYEDEEDK